MTDDDKPPSQRPTQEVPLFDVIKPSEVLAVINRPVSAMPLSDTFGRTGQQAAAYYITIVCARKHDVYAPIGFEDIRVTYAEYLQNKWITNPDFRPDFADLVQHGFAAWVSESPWQIALTPTGLDQLRSFLQRWS